MTDLKAIGQLVRNGEPIPGGLILLGDDGRMVVDGTGWFDTFGGIYSETPKAGWEMRYYGWEIRRIDGVVRYVRNTHGEKIRREMTPRQVRGIVRPMDVM